ncbi:hypothetical protein ACWEQP_13620 [Streptomyces sp. NPDC004044]
MGVRLIVEILDHWPDAGLTAGERDDLIVLAENANENTRLTWGPVHAPYILKRANKSAASWKNAIGKLLKKKVLTQHTPGRIGQVAVYHLTCLCPEPPHDGYQGFCTRPERGTSQMAHPEEAKEEGHLSDDPQGHSTDDPEAVEGHLSDDERVTGDVTPTPLVPSFNSPSNTPSSSLAEVESDVLEGVVIEGGGGGSDSFQESIKEGERVSAFLGSLDFRGKVPSKRQRLKLGPLVAAAFEAGWTEQTLGDYLDLGGAAVNSATAVYLHRLGEDELPEPPAFIAAGRPLPPPCAQCFDTYREAAQTNLRLRVRDGQPCPDCHPSVVGTQDSSDGGMWDRAMDRARSRMGLTGTDGIVSGWMALSEQLGRQEGERMPSAWLPKPSTTDQRVHQALEAGRRVQAAHDARNNPGGHKPYSGAGWDAINEQVANGTRPEGADGIPHCGDSECDEYSRTRMQDGFNGPEMGLCARCHPAMQFG